MLKQYNWLHNIDYKIQVIQYNECHLERCLSGKCSIHHIAITSVLNIFWENIESDIYSSLNLNQFQEFQPLKILCSLSD